MYKGEMFAGGLMPSKGPRMTPATRRIALVAAAAVVFLAGCSSGSSGGGNGTGGGPTNGAASGSNTSASGLSLARSRAKQAEAVPTFTAHAVLPKAKVRALAGKTIWFVSEGQSIPYFAAVYQGIQQGAAALGMKAKVFDAQGSVSAQNQGVQTAISQGAAGIVLGFPPDQLEASLGAKAKAAGIPITDAGVVDLKDPLIPGDVGHVAWSYARGGADQADWVVADSGGDAHVYAILSSGYKVQDYRLAGFTHELKSLCPSCSVEGSQHVPFTQWTSQLPTIVSTALTQHPDVNYILVADDAQVLYVRQGIKRVPNSKVKVVSSDASTYNLGLVKKGDTEFADQGEPENWIGWATVDVIVRFLTTGTAGNEAVPLRLFTQSNLPRDYQRASADWPVDWAGDFKKEWAVD